MDQDECIVPQMMLINRVFLVRGVIVCGMLL
jgi:hypothetical protein